MKSLELLAKMVIFKVSGSPQFYIGGRWGFYTSVIVSAAEVP